MNLTLLRIILGVLGLVPIFIGVTGMFSGLERLVSGANSPQTRTVSTDTSRRFTWGSAF